MGLIGRTSYTKHTILTYCAQQEKYLAPIPVAERGDLMSAYYRRLTGHDERVRLEAAKVCCDTHRQ
jgi:hypothetical protein